jgi:parvulin-like peptidyl-prolyl isomerase
MLSGSSRVRPPLPAFGRRGCGASSFVVSLVLALSAAVLCALAPSARAAQDEESPAGSKPVAVYDGGVVTVDQFLKAFDETAAEHPGENIIQYKNVILENIVKADILAREAKERGYVDESGEWDPKIIEEKEKAMVNYLRREVILKGVVVSEEQIRDLYDKSDVRRLTREITVSNREDADRVAGELGAGADFLDLVRKWSLDRGSAEWNGVMAWVKIGDAPEEIENLLLGLKVGEVGGPLETDQGYYFLRVDSLVYKEDMPRYEEARPRLRSRLLARVRTPVVAAFMDSVAEARGVTYNDEAIKALYGRFQREGWIDDDKPGRDARIPSYTSEELGMPIFGFEDVSYPVADYLDYIRDMHVNPAYYLAGREEIERGLKGFVRRKLELVVAYEMGLDKARSVRGYVREKAKDKGIADMLVEAGGGDESVHATEEERKEFYEENKWKYTRLKRIVVSMVTVSDRAVVDQLYDDMSSGVPMSQVMEDYRWVIVDDRSGERVEFTEEQAKDSPKIFDTARRMKLGAVSEPIPLPGRFYSIIKLLEREPAGVMPYSEVRDEVRVDLNLKLLQAATKRMDDFKESMMTKYHYRVNEDVFDGIKL